MKLTDKENLELMENAERMTADMELRKRKKEIGEIAKLSTQTILITMPQAIKNLQQAYENLIIVETKIENEIIQKENKSRNGVAALSVHDGNMCDDLMSVVNEI